METIIWERGQVVEGFEHGDEMRQMLDGRDGRGDDRSQKLEEGGENEVFGQSEGSIGS